MNLNLVLVSMTLFDKFVLVKMVNSVLTNLKLRLLFFNHS